MFDKFDVEDKNVLYFLFKKQNEDFDNPIYSVKCLDKRRVMASVKDTTVMFRKMTKLELIKGTGGGDA